LDFVSPRTENRGRKLKNDPKRGKLPKIAIKVISQDFFNRGGEKF